MHLIKYSLFCIFFNKIILANFYWSGMTSNSIDKTNNHIITFLIIGKIFCHIKIIIVPEPIFLSDNTKKKA